MNNGIIYLGYSDSAGIPEFPNWKPVPNTLEAIQKGIEEGYTAKTILALEYEPQKGKPEPKRWGPLVMDFDNKQNPERAISAAQFFVKNLCMHYGLHPEWLRYWISGSKGCHIEIPEAVIGSEEGHTELHKIYSFMVRTLAMQCISLVSGDRGMIDYNMYCGGKGRLLRIENIRRPNCRYKVPVSAQEFLDMTPNELMELTISQKFIPQNELAIPRSERLFALYKDMENTIDSISPRRRQEILEGIDKCPFLTKCVEQADTLSEPEWWAFISELAPLGYFGKQLIHQFSRHYPGYSPDETDRKIMEAENENKPKRCSYIKAQGWVECSRDCNMHSPYDLLKKDLARKTLQKFIQTEDGLYHCGEDGSIKICTPIAVVGVAAEYDDWGWSRIIELKDSGGCKKTIIMPMKAFADPRSQWLSTLMDGGLVLAPFQKARTLLHQYLTQTTEQMEKIRICDRIGWLPDGGYLLPDICYGSPNKVLYSGDSETKFHLAGTLEDWQNAIGTYCSGNPLLVFATSFALTGPMLELLPQEGGGLHIYGGSSKGKSTIAMVSGSVCGGGGPEGFITQWRTTDNALEKVAAAHNDNLLVLDEVGQAVGSAVYKIIYMLANRQGKMRMKSDCSQRKPFVWNLNFLSTGELTIGDKIKEDGRMQPMAGQEVRVIDIPIDSGLNENPFQKLHGFSNPGALSNYLKAQAKKIYGAPMRAFVEKLTQDKLSASKDVSDRLLTFFDDNVSEGASQQIQRVLMKFALIAAVGEFAIKMGIFPYKQGESIEAAAKYFKVWITQRNGLQDGEVLAALERIRCHFETCKATYIDLNDPEDLYRQEQFRKEVTGYKFYDGKNLIFFALSPTLRILFGGCNKKALLEEMDMRGWLAHNSSGNVLESKSIGNQNVRGVGFIPAKIQ